MIRFGADVCTDLGAARRREWLETNGLGGFASSTIVGLNTRRYHALLVAATAPPVGRVVLLSKLDETVVIDGDPFALATNQYPGSIHPDGYRHIRELRLDPFPVTTFRVRDVTVEKAVFMIHGENTTIIEYTLQGEAGAAVVLELRPLVAGRDYHALVHENGAIDGHVHRTPGGIIMRPYSGLPPLCLSFDEGDVSRGNGWYRRFEYDVEHQRGLDWVEDLFNPCVLRLPLTASRPVTIAIATAPVASARARRARSEEAARRLHLVDRVRGADAFTRTLVAAADQFIVRRGSGHSVVAGYHWFSDWGRDTMIALPGVAMETRRTDIARDIVAEFLRHVSRGMIPNRFSDAGAAEYTSVDATLWLFQAIHPLTPRGAPVADDVYERLTDIIDWHIRGTRHNIHVDDDGLLVCGPANVPLTWMDVKLGDRIVTPRFGKPVEVQALWYNALRILMRLAAARSDRERRRRCAELAWRARRSFMRLFWNADDGCLYDVVDGDRRDASIRPNQAIALGLPFAIVPRAAAISALAVVERELLTPFGLRTLARSDPQYCPRFAGDMHARDSAYHQGTVWPWLFGPFATAYLKLHPTADAAAQVRRWLEPFAAHLADAGLGQVSEVFDGDAPHRPGGCIAQAWSVGELLRVARLIRV